MAIINLRDSFPEYELNCFIEVPDGDTEVFLANISREAAEVYFSFQRKENAYNRRVFWNKAHYSLDRNDGIHTEAIYELDSTFALCMENITRQRLIEALSRLPDKQAKRIYAHFVLGRSKAEIARSEGINESKVRKAIERGIENLKKYLQDFTE